jgi:ribonuclease Z
MSVELEVAGIAVRAVSVGGLETCIELPGWSLCFDIGRCPPTAARLGTVLITHPHIDHLGGIAHHVGLRDLWKMKPPTYVIPADYADDFNALLDTWRRLDRSELPCRVVPIRPGEEHDLGKGRFVRAFRAVHRVPTLGYALIRRKARLRPELAGLPGEEIGRRRAAGEDVTFPVEEIEVAFCGDTTVDVLRNPEVRTARLLILECTFPAEDVPVEKARRSGHVHLDELLPRFAELENERILMTHFSSRYSAAHLLDVLDRRLPPDIRAKVVPLLPGPPWQ